MSSWFAQILDVAPIWVYLIVGLLVFAEDAIFVGFVLPGETAAVLGGVAANRGHADVVVVAIVVVVAAIVGDSVGYEIGKKLGPALLGSAFARKHGARIGQAQGLLARRGGPAVFLGRFVAFFRAVMPALAGASRMAYRTFLPYNALGGLVWGVGFVLLGYLAGASYQAVEHVVGQGAAVVVAAVVVVVLVVWRVRRGRTEG